MTENDNLIKTVVSKAEIWLNGNYDNKTKEAVKAMLDNPDKTDLIESFYKDLEFGTGGLRGIMGVGTNRVNVYTIGAATQGLANYLLQEFSQTPQISVAIGYDCRNNSKLFAETTANILSANGIKAYLFESLRPTPEVSYAIRKLSCQSGIVITASHNPKEYNGYKVYWNDGAQVVAPHDRNIIAEVNRIQSIDNIKFEGNTQLIQTIGKEIDQQFIQDITGISLSPESISRQKDLKIVYTPIHGSGVMLVPDALKALGFTNIIHVPEQDVVSGDFPTVTSPNPEEANALSLAIQTAQQAGADLVFATDPDADRIGAAVRNDKNEFVILNGNQIFLIYIYYLTIRWNQLGRMTGKEYAVRTIVTTSLVDKIAQQNNVEMYECYTGFKWIAAIMRENEGKKTYIGGGEESHGFLAEDFVRDKDAVSASLLLAEVAAWAKDQGKTVFELLQDIYLEYGFSKEKGISVVKKGKSGAEEIEAMMKNFRENPLTEIAGSKVIMTKDFAKLEGFDYNLNEAFTLAMPSTSNVLQYFTENGTKISIRPSGTEPKIKFYIEVKGKLKEREQYDQVNKEADELIEKIRKDLNI